MKILFVASEATPYAASGGLGDVMGALPKSIVEDNPSAEVGVVVPLYDTMKSEYREKLEKVADISFRYSWRNTGASVYKLENSGVNNLLSFTERFRVGYFIRWSERRVRLNLRIVKNAL